MPSIRYAREADAEAISTLLRQLQHPSSPDYLQDRIQQITADESQCVLVAADAKEKVVGVLSLQMTDQFHEEPPVARILDLCILESQRGKNIGRQLFNRAEEIAKEYGCCRLEVTADNFRLGAHQFYALLSMDQTHRYFAKKI